tara:strand:- start:8629 stop:9000 length:372 start_codon:yes stop_codon:yes gene_type:complete
MVKKVKRWKKWSLLLQQVLKWVVVTILLFYILGLTMTFGLRKGGKIAANELLELGGGLVYYTLLGFGLKTLILRNFKKQNVWFVFAQMLVVAHTLFSLGSKVYIARKYGTAKDGESRLLFQHS